MKFDCLLTNPPYQDSSHSEKKNTLWRKWISFDKIINKGGTVALHHPSSWMGSSPILKEHFLDENSRLNKNITKINVDECKRHYPGVGSFFSYYVYNKEIYNNKTKLIVKNIDGTIEKFETNLNDCLISVFPRDLSTIGLSIIKKCLNLPPLGIINDTYCHGVKKEHWRLVNDDVFRYPVRRNMKQTIFFDYPHPNQNDNKLLIPTTTQYRNMFITTDAPSQSFCYFKINNNFNPTIVMNNINNTLFDYLNECFRYSNWNSVGLLRKLPKIPLDVIMTDEEIYEHLSLTNDEIKHIKKIVKWR